MHPCFSLKLIEVVVKIFYDGISERTQKNHLGFTNFFDFIPVDEIAHSVIIVSDGDERVARIPVDRAEFHKYPALHERNQGGTAVAGHQLH